MLSRRVFGLLTHSGCTPASSPITAISMAVPRRYLGSVSAIDSVIFRTTFGTEDMRKVFSDKSYIARCIDAETALARAQSRCKVIPAEMGKQITEKAQEAGLDYDRLRIETEIVGYPILPLVRQLSTMCGDDAGRYVHWGATTQDIMDIASMLQIKEGLSLIEGKLNNLNKTLAHLSIKYRDTPMAGRTHLQHALPITFGYKCAVWLSSIQRAQERLKQLLPRTLFVQFGGAAGSLTSLSPGVEGIQVRKAMAEDLGLVDPPITWHVARDGLAEITNLLAIIGGSLGKIALDIIIMSSNELGEVSEPFVPHRGASSTMPQKRNPISSEVILASSKILRSNAGLVLDAMVSDFERASGPWHLEWVAIPESFVVAMGALHQAEFVLSGLVVNEGKMLSNLKSTQGLIVAEAVMLALAKASSDTIGRNAAHDIVYAACKECIETEKSLLDVLAAKEKVVQFLDREKLAEICDETKYLGSCMRMVDNVLSWN